MGPSYLDAAPDTDYSTPALDVWYLDPCIKCSEAVYYTSMVYSGPYIVYDIQYDSEAVHWAV